MFFFKELYFLERQSEKRTVRKCEEYFFISVALEIEEEIPNNWVFESEILSFQKQSQVIFIRNHGLKALLNC